MTINPSESEAERARKTFLENPWSKIEKAASVKRQPAAIMQMRGCN